MHAKAEPTSLFQRRCFPPLMAMVVVALCCFARPLSATTLPGEPVSIQVQSAQRKAEKAFDAGDHDRARWYYEKVLAPVGDKYAQYMLGYLSEAGLERPVDRTEALAWYRLAAERDYEPLVAEYRRLRDQLSEAERNRADRRYEELAERYGDPVLLRRAIERNERILRQRTGSRTGGYAGPLLILRPNGRISDGDRYYDMIERRIELQTQLLGGTVELGELELIDPPPEAGSGATGEDSGNRTEGEKSGESEGEARRENENGPGAQTLGSVAEGSGSGAGPDSR